MKMFYIYYPLIFLTPETKGPDTISLIQHKS